MTGVQTCALPILMRVQQAMEKELASLTLEEVKKEMETYIFKKGI